MCMGVRPSTWAWSIYQGHVPKGEWVLIPQWAAVASCSSNRVAWSCASNHSCYTVMCAAAMFCSEICILQFSSHPPAPTFFLFPLLPCFLHLSWGEVDSNDPFVTEFLFTYSWHFDQLWDWITHWKSCISDQSREQHRSLGRNISI